MTLAVGHGYTLEYLLDLPLTQFNDLVDSILRVSKRTLSETGMVIHLASQAGTKDLVKYLKSMTGEPKVASEEESKEHAAQRAAMNSGGGGKKRGR